MLINRFKDYQVYTLFLIIIGIAIIAFGFNYIANYSLWFPFMLFSILSIITESLSISLNNSTYISMGFAVSLCALITFHPFIATVTMFFGTILRIYKQDNKYCHILNSSLYKRVFNGSAHALSAFSAGYSYVLGQSLMTTAYISHFNVLGIVFAIISYVSINTLIYMSLFSMLEKTSLRTLMLKNIWVIKNFIAIAPLGIFMSIAYTNYGWFALLLFFGPLLLARYSFKLYIDMRNVYFETIMALSNAVDAKDHYTNGHSHRVGHYAVLIGNKMGLTGKSIDILKTAAILHDIGKIGIDDYILNKPGNLTSSEFSIIQQHPLIGAKILKDVDFLGEAVRIIKHHHERYDGQGYPEGLSGGEIPIEAAILSVADAFDAMTSNRPYRNAMSFDAAINIVTREAGKQFNPIVVKILKDLMENSREMLINVS